jgi:lysophospholipase L1-like esterase
MVPLPGRVLLQWSSGYNRNYLEPNPAASNNGYPTAYSIEVSSSSEGGGWTQLVKVDNNKVRTRTHLLEFAEGIAWVRMSVPARVCAALDEIDVYDATHLLQVDGKSFLFDSWFFLGDSISADAFDRSEAHGSFADNVKTRTGGEFFPVLVNGGVGGDTTQKALARLDSALEEQPNIRFWAIGLGTNNMGKGNDGFGLEGFHKGLLQIVERIQAAGRTPVVANIPFNQKQGSATCELARPDTPKFNAEIQKVIDATGALQGPDLYTYFKENCRQLNDLANLNQEHIHPNAEGYKAMNALWAKAVAELYKSP